MWDEGYWDDLARTGILILGTLGVIVVVSAVFALVKGKYRLALIGGVGAPVGVWLGIAQEVPALVVSSLLIGVLPVIAALRIAKPESVWAEGYDRHGPKMALARRRFPDAPRRETGES